MKARLLKQLLNNTTYKVGNYDKYIGIGSPVVHNLIQVDKDTLSISFALGGVPNVKELIFIWEKLHELVKSGQLYEIISGKDEVNPKLPVFTVANGELISSFTDEYGYPNTDDDGVVMYENTHFRTESEALEFGIREQTEQLKWIRESIEEHVKDIHKLEVKKRTLDSQLDNLKYLQKTRKVNQ